MAAPVQIICRADKTVQGFVADLALHSLDLLLADAPVAASASLRAYSHPLGECGTTFFAHRKVTLSSKGEFPAVLNGAPFILPGGASAVRHSLDRFFAAKQLRPSFVAEFDDSALTKEFGRQGMGVFCAPSVIENEVVSDYGVQVIGRAAAVRQQFFAISIERKIRHPAVAAICEAAREELFNAPKPQKRTRKSKGPR
jgi:LysR family transcriptional regulator, transcriptional activator of nhaA